MKRFDKNKVTIILITYRAEDSIETTVTSFKIAGFNNILVVDENSRENMVEIVRKLGVKRINVKARATFDMAVLRGIYETNNTSIFILSDHETKLDQVSLIEFLEYGTIGDYPLLFPQSNSNRSVDIADRLKKRLGIFLDEPGFEAVFINEKMANVIKSDISSGGTYIFYKFIKAAIDNHLKIGVYPLKLTERPSSYGFFTRMRRERRLRSDKFSHTKFIQYGFPDVYYSQMRRDIIVAIFSITFGLILPKIFTLINNLVFN